MRTISPYLAFYGNWCSADDDIAEIRAFQNEIESLITRENSNLLKVQVESDENEELYAKKIRFEHTLRRNLRNSVIVSLVTFLEIELQRYCLELQDALSIAIRHDEVRGSILDQFKTYTNKTCNLNIDFGSEAWQSVKEVIELRNCIVHHDGWIEDWYGRKFSRTDSIRSLGMKFNSLQIEERDLIVLGDGACEKCIEIVESFIKIIYEIALNRFPNRGNPSQNDDRGPF